MRVPVFGLGTRSRSAAVTAAQLQNFYLESRPQGEKSQLVAYGTPGLDLFATFGDTPVRGMLTVEPVDKFYPVHRGTLYSVNNAGTKTSLGTLATTEGNVYQAHDGTVLLTVDGTSGYTLNTGTDAFATVVDADFIATPKTVTWIDGYFVVANRSVFQISTDGTSWNAADIGVPESNPDGIVRVFADHGQLTIFGDISTEFWENTGATDFPFSPIKSATIEWGCASAASVCKFNDSVAFLAQNRMGQVSVAMLKGYTPQIISTPDIDNIINGYASVNDATAFSYMLGGHPMYQINFPAAGYSWLFDASTGKWSSLKSYGISRQRSEIGIQFITRTIVSDYSTGDLYEINPLTYTENGEMIESEIVSENIADPDKTPFPIDRFRVDMETGVGLVTGQGSDPQVMLQVSEDGGNSWGSEMWMTAGAIGVYGRRVEWRRLGAPQSGEVVFKVRITDPVKRAIVSAMLNPPS